MMTILILLSFIATCLFSHSYEIILLSLLSLSMFIITKKKIFNISGYSCNEDVPLCWLSFSIGLCINSIIFNAMSWAATKNQLIIIAGIMSLLISGLVVLLYYFEYKSPKRLKVTVDQNGKIVGYATFTKV